MVSISQPVSIYEVFYILKRAVGFCLFDFLFLFFFVNDKAFLKMETVIFYKLMYILGLRLGLQTVICCNVSYSGNLESKK